MFSPHRIEVCYKTLSILYKNPTRDLGQLAASNVDEALFETQQKLLRLFREAEAELRSTDLALYYKILSLLYEIDDYRGAESPVHDLIDQEGHALLAKIRSVNNGQTEFQPPATRPQEISGNKKSSPRDCFTTAYDRSYWKARVICCVAMVETGRRPHEGRRTKSLDELAQELEVLEDFVKNHLHQEDAERFAWTTLAFVQSAQARIARQGQDYRLAEHKLLKATESLDGRAKEIGNIVIGKLSRNESIEELKDDLLSIRRKQTLISFFNVALAAIQRGFLRTANRACQSARLQFRLHGHNYQKIFNDLIILSIERAQTPRDDDQAFETLEAKLESDIISKVKTDAGRPTVGNRKLYLYALRERALLQSYQKHIAPMLTTLDTMENESAAPLNKQWRSRIYHQRARAYWIKGREENNAEHFQTALGHAHTAFNAASVSDRTIESYEDAGTLEKAIRGSKRSNVIETIESLITYGSIQASARNFKEAVKTADAVIQSCDETNPRLLAMGYLVRAEAYVETGRILDAKQDVAKARILLRRIDHTYVADRLRDIEKHWLTTADNVPLADLKTGPRLWAQAHARLLGWAIQNHTNKESINKIAKDLGIDKRNIEAYLKAVEKDKDDPYHHLGEILRKSKTLGERRWKSKTEEASESDLKPPEEDSLDAT